MDQRARDVIAMGDALFTKKRVVDQLMQEIALNFYPERADFTSGMSAMAKIGFVLPKPSRSHRYGRNYLVLAATE